MQTGRNRDARKACERQRSFCGGGMPSFRKVLARVEEDETATKNAASPLARLQKRVSKLQFRLMLSRSLSDGARTREFAAIAVQKHIRGFRERTWGMFSSPDQHVIIMGRTQCSPSWSRKGSAKWFNGAVDNLGLATIAVSPCRNRILIQVQRMTADSSVVGPPTQMLLYGDRATRALQDFREAMPEELNDREGGQRKFIAAAMTGALSLTAGRLSFASSSS
eukprot:g5403.t1